MKPQELNNRIDEISALLSDPNIDIKTALSLFEEGVGLVKTGYDEIKSANAKITELKQVLDSYSEIKFDEE